MDHIRIDEGVKRGPRKGKPKLSPGPKPSSPRRDNGQFVNVLPNDQEAIRNAIEAYRTGATLQQIANHYQVTKQAVYGWLLGELGGEQHSMLVTQALTSRIASADDNLDSADNPLDLARAREQCRNSRLDLERRRAHLYGPKQEVTHTVTPQFSISLCVNPVAVHQTPQLPESIDGTAQHVSDDGK